MTLFRNSGHGGRIVYMAQTGKIQAHMAAIAEYLLAAVFIALGGTMYQYTAPLGGYLSKICMAVIAVAVIACFFLKRPYKDKSCFLRGIIITAVICVYLAVFALINPVNVKSYLVQVCQVAALSVYVFICCGKDRIPGALTRYSKLITAIALISLVCWIWFSLIRTMPPTGKVDSTWYSTFYTKPVSTFYYVYFEPQGIKFFGHVFVRNCSIFTEAPMFAWHLLIALMTELFISRKLSWLRTCILCAALISTFSTMGYIFGLGAVILRLVLALVRSRRYRNMRRKVKIAAWIIVAVLVVAAAVISLVLLKEKLVTYSGDTRMEDFKAGFLGWMDNFWTGAGFGNRETIFIHRTVFSQSGFSNGIMEVAAEGGVYLLICFVGPFVFGFIDALIRKDGGLAIFAVLVFVMASITSAQYTCLMYFLQLFMLLGIMTIKKRGTQQQ